jgi:hypothetical protein
MGDVNHRREIRMIGRLPGIEPIHRDHSVNQLEERGHLAVDLFVAKQVQTLQPC